jgi:hypothetical protein
LEPMSLTAIQFPPTRLYDNARSACRLFGATVRCAALVSAGLLDGGAPHPLQLGLEARRGPARPVRLEPGRARDQAAQLLGTVRGGAASSGRGGGRTSGHIMVAPEGLQNGGRARQQGGEVPRPPPKVVAIGTRSLVDLSPLFGGLPRPWSTTSIWTMVA